MITTLTHVIELKEFRQQAAETGASVAFVPTMGALHEGHLALVAHARQLADIVVLSVFVNPLQFGPQEDFAQYPRMLRDDLAKAEAAGVTAVFAPPTSEIYPSGFATTVDNPEQGNILCGAARPGHFRGVLTIVLKLLNLVQPQALVMGKKDYQQLALIRTMVRDLDLPVAVHGVDTVRDPDGLAMSSRNAYLTAEQRSRALALPQALQAAARQVADGLTDSAALVDSCRQALNAQADVDIDYVEARRRADLCEPADGQLTPGDSVILAAVRVGTVRLIDNVEV